MNKSYMIKRNALGQSVVCSEKTKARGKVKSIALAVATASAMLASVDAVAATATSAGTAVATGDTAGNLAMTSAGTATATGGNSIAIGENATAYVEKSIIIGSDSASSSTGKNDIVIGNNNFIANPTISGKDSGIVVLGNNKNSSLESKSANEFKTITIGNDNTMGGTFSSAIKSGIIGQNSTIAGNDYGGVTNGYILGNDSVIKVSSCTTNGGINIQVLGSNSTVTGGTDANHLDSYNDINLIGFNNNIDVASTPASFVDGMTHTKDISVLGNNNMGGDGVEHASVVGGANTIGGVNVSTIGFNNFMFGHNSVIIGNSNNLATENTFAIGNNITTATNMSVVLGTDSASYESGTATAGRADYPSYSINGETYNFAGTTPHNIISVGATGKEGRIQNVASGMISATSTDAINGSQLYAAYEAIEKIQATSDTDKSVRVAGSDLVTVTNTTGAADGITTMTDYTVSINKGEFAPVSATGALSAPTTDGVATVSDVVTAVNSGYWTANVDDSTKVADVKFGDSLNFVDGAATDAVVKNGGVSFNVKTDGNTIVVDDATNSIKVNTDALPKTVVAQGNNTVVSSETVGTTTTYTVDAEKTTVSKAATSPITVTEGAKSATGVTNYEVGLSIDDSTLEVVDGKLTAKVVDTDTNTDKSVRVAGSDLVTVTNTTGAADGITTMTDYTVSINKGSFGTSTDGSIVTGTDGVATVGDVMTAVNAGYWTANVGGAKLADVGFGDTLNFFDGNGTKAVIKNGGVAYDLNIKSSDNSIITAPSADGSVDLTVNSSMIPSTVVDAGKGIDVTPVTNGNTTTYTVAVDDTIADKQYVADEIAKIPVVTDTNTDKSVRVKSDSELLTVAGTAGAADGITTMTDYTITLSDKVATKDFVTDEIAKIQLPVDTNTISEVAQGDGITVNAVTEGDKTTYTVALDDATKAQLAKEESVVAKAGETNIVVTQPRTNGTGGNEYEVSLAKDLTGIDSIGKDGSKFTFNGDSISAGNVNITDVKSPVNATDAANKQYVDDAIAKIPAVVDTNTDKSVRVKSDSNLLTVTSKAGEADGITQMTDYTISLSDKVATTDYVDGEIAKIPTVKAGDNIAVKQDTVDGKPVVVVSADKSTVSQGDGIAVTVTETPTANGAVNRDYKVSLDDATKGTLAKVEKGINTKAEDGKVTNHQLGDTISVVGDNKNITTATTEDGAISVKMADDIKVNSVSINNTGITIGGSGIHAGDMKVTGVAPGTLSPSSTDAVNGSQLYATNMNVAQNTQNIADLDKRMTGVENEMDAIGAGSLAASGLPQATLPGKSMFAFSAGTYGRAQAVAVGFSRVSDSANTILKGTLNANTENKFGASIGLGFQW